MFKNTLQIRFTYEDDRGGTVHCQQLLSIQEVDGVVDGAELVRFTCEMLRQRIQRARGVEKKS